MKLKTTAKRLLALLLLLTMVLGIFPVPAMATEAPAEEKPATKAGTDYTSTINALEKPAAGYSQHEDLSNIPSGSKVTVGTGDYVLLVTVSGQSYAFAPNNLTSDYSTTVDSVSVTVDQDGNHLHFAKEEDVRNATITFKPNAEPSWAYERLFVRRDGLVVQPIGQNGLPYFRAVQSTNETYGFNYVTGEDGLVVRKGIVLNSGEGRTNFSLVYKDGSFFFGNPSDYPRGENTTFYFYQMHSITENLYNALQAAKTYATGNGSGTYDPELYAGFTAMLDECIQVYQDLNHYLTKTELADVVALQDALDTRADSLNAYMQVLAAAGSTPNYATYSTVLKKIPASRGWDNHVVDFTGKTDFRNLDGTYFIVGTSHLMDPTATPSVAGHIAAVPVTVENKRVTNASLSQAIDLVYEETADGSDSKCYFFRAQDGNYLRAERIDGTYTISWGHAHQAMGLGYITNDTIDRERVYFYRNVNYDLNGNYLETNSARLNFDTENTSFALKPQGTMNSNYRLYRLTWSTEDLLAAIEEMIPYTNSNGSGIVPGVYQDFLSCLDQSIALYLKYNIAHTPEQLDQTVAIQAELKAQVIRLLSYKDILKSDYSQVIDNLPTPYNELYTGPLSQRHSMRILQVCDGIYYIVHLDPSGNGSTGWAMAADDGLYDQTASNRLYGAPVRIEGDQVINGQTSYAFNLKGNTTYPYEFSPWPVNNLTFYVNKGKAFADNDRPNALCFENGAQVALQPTLYNNGFTLHCNKDFDGTSGNEQYYLQYSSELQGFRPTRLDCIQGETSRFRLYRISSQILDLYNAIQQVAVYAAGNEDGRYPTDKYNAFLECLQESIDLYQYYNTSLEEVAIKEKLDKQAKDLLAHIGILTLADTKVDYIDVPIEILDFRADGFMFEYETGSSYGLNSISALSNYYGADIANSLKAYNAVIPPGSSYSVAQDLTLPHLVGENMVYTEEAVMQVAYSLMAGLYKQEANIPNQSNQVKTKVDKLSDKVKALIPESPNWPEIIASPEWLELLGSPEDTYSKTSTPTKNGGELEWGKVETAYDLAYYILNYLWRPVAATDKQDNGDFYNVSVPQRDVFRMFRDEDTGLYTLDAYNRVEYTGSYVCNAYPATDNLAHYNSPNFTPIDGLGFETPDSEGNMAPDTDRSQHLYDRNNYSTNGTNYHFTVHAKGSFVYYEEQDLYFEFLGDDDVYFYINGKRAMDLGGGHSAAKGILHLNDKAAELGLVDGEVYSFDMFYAERKTSASNLKFSTNIKLADPNTMISKGQYAVELNGENHVDPNTGKGTALADNATVRVGDVIAYSFDLRNTREVPILNLEFHDPSLGVILTKDSITTYTGTLADGSTGTSLTNPDSDYANGVVTQYEDLLLEYCTLDENRAPVSSPVYEKTAQEMESLILATYAVPEGSHYMTLSQLPAGCYRVRVSSSDDLTALLEAGVPLMCTFSLYGFLRITTVDDLPYQNNLTVSYSYPYSTDINDGYGTGGGQASRQIRVLPHSSLPQVRELEVVLDYGKAVTVPLEDISDLIHFEDGSPVKVGSVEGFLKDSYSGQLLKKLPEDLFCTEIGETFTGTQGSYSLTAQGFTFTPTQFLTEVESLYAVVQVEDFYYGMETSEEFRYIVAKMTFIPATVMYYETDFAPNIFTMAQVGGGTEWKLSTDKTDAADPNQDYERLNGTVYHTDIAREYIPAEAFFVDFDGEGYERRYRDNPQYSGVDFDKATAWYSHNTRNSIYNKHTLNAAAGTMELSNLKATDANGNNLGAWIQTIIPGKDIGSNALRLAAGKGHYAQIRFRVENCKSYAGSGNISIFFSNSKDGETEGDVAKEERRTRVALSNAEVLSGNYMTVRIPLDDTYYGESDSIDIMRLYIAGYTDDGTGKGKITVDYIYVGPEMGMEDDVYGNYLFVGFDDTPADHLRYSSSIYGAKTSGMTYRDLDKAGSWVSPSAKDSIRIESGCLVFEDKLDDSRIAEGNSKNYNCVHAGTFGTGEGVYNLPISYTPTMNDFCQIRLKIENADLVWDEKTNKYLIPSVAIEYKQGNISGRGDLDASYIDSGFHTITFPLDAPYWKKHWNESGDVLQWLHPVIYNLQGKNGSYTGAKFTIDYIFIGPEHLLERVSQHVDPVSQPLNHLFFDFNNDDAAKLRYTNSVYGGINMDDGANWRVNTNKTKSYSINTTNGVLTFEDNDLTNDTESNYNYVMMNDRSLNYVIGEEDYCRVRLKVEGGSDAKSVRTDGQISLAIMFATTDKEDTTGASAGYTYFKLADYLNKGYFTLTFPLGNNHEKYAPGNILEQIAPQFGSVQGVKFTIDWLYIGPMTESNPSAPSLYFGFGNRGSGHWNTDSLRYDSDTYGFLNYDTNRWLSESEAVASSLTESVYGWGTAGNEDRGDAVADDIKDYVPAFPPVETVTYPAIEVSTRPETGHLELTVEEGTTDPIGIQTYPSVSSTRYYWRHFMQALNYHPAEENIVQVRFKTENLTIGEDFAVKLMYLPAGASAYCTSAPLKLAPLMPMNPEEDYVIMTAALDDSFTNAPAIERLRLVFEGVSADNGNGKILMDYIYAGVGRIAPEPVYGYDSSYDNDSKLSNGSSYEVEGQGVKLSNTTAKYTEASFSFRGTGFDIISRTGKEQATIRLEVMNNATKEVVKSLTVNNKGELELYQIPVVSVQGLEYGEYTVTFWVNVAVDSQYEFLSRGGQFHFDAVRIYDPMGEDARVAPEILHAYLVDNEGYASVKEVRNILLSAEDFASQLTGSRAIFVDSEDVPTADVPATDANDDPIPGSTTTVVPEGITFINSHITASVTTYDKIGPKNEVYLAPGQAVAFMLKISTEYVPTSVDVGVKTIKDNEPANLVAGIVTKVPTVQELLKIAGRRDVTIRSATAQYYALPIDVNAFFEPEDGNRYCYIVLYNNGTSGTTTNVLSITDIKIAYDDQPELGLPQDAPLDPEVHKRTVNGSQETYFDFVVDGKTLEAAALVMKAVLETPVLAESGKLMHSLNLASDIAINYVVKKADLADYDSFYLECVIPGQAEPLRIDPVEKDGYYYFTLEGLTAVQMGDKITATLYLEKNGRTYYWQPDTYSIAQYAYSQLNKAGANAKLKTLCAELLRYGSMAQLYKGYRTDALADEAMTTAQKALLTDLNAVTFSSYNRELGDLTSPTVKWVGKSLILDSKVTLRYIVDLTSYEGSLEDLSLRISYKDYEGKEQTAIITEVQKYGTQEGRYSFDFDGLLAAELRTVLHAAVYAGDTQISTTLEYSVDTYGANKTGTLGDLCRALMAYSDSAYSYFR